ncbi:MAG: hypothetical protein EXX96DRAFT_198935 [Benjaminiella poitrasii]|nr:MAG: hypothetical protein EXX96DRAFT_198935 [Benjaminiella poitrasii]
MGNNISSSKNDIPLRGHYPNRKSSIKTSRSPSPNKLESYVNNNTSKEKIASAEIYSVPLEPTTAINIGKRSSRALSPSTNFTTRINSSQQETSSDISDEIDRDTPSPLPERQGIHNKRIKSSQARVNSYRQSRISYSQDRYSSTLSATSGFSSNFGDPLHFSMIADSAITDLTNTSSFSVNSFLDKMNDDKINNYIMAAPDSDFIDNNVLPLGSTDNATPLVEQVTTTDEIIDLLTKHPESAYDILTSIYGSHRMRSDTELQKEAFQAVETWSLRPTDVTAKMIVACCKLCGWGTTKNSKRGFTELQMLAKRGVWEAYYYLGRCYLYGVTEQPINANDTSSHHRPHSSQVVQTVDYEQAIYWYKKVIESPSNLQSERVQFYIAEAQLRIITIYFTTGKINKISLNESVNYLRESVSAGNRKSEFALGFLIETGVVEDTIDAKEYYTQSANKGYAPSQVQLALILLNENSSEGISWLNKASRLGDPRAFYHLGESYEFGRCVPVDTAMAVHYYQTAADKYNHSMSGFRLGMHYLQGGLELLKDDTKAFFYLERAAKAGYPDAQYLLGMMYRDGKVSSATRASVLRSQSPQGEITMRHKKEAFRWVRRAALQDMHTAITQIATFYEEGMGCPVNYALATEYYELATSKPGKQLPSAQLTYARFLHKNGYYEKALEMYLYASGMKRSSSLNTHPPSDMVSRTAKRMVALLYLDQDDTTTPYKPKEAYDILTSLASSPEGDADAEYWIAVCHEEGVNTIVPINLSKAYEYYVNSANLGSSDSQFQVGHMLCKGIGVNKDRVAAFKWFQKSAETNNPKALYYIGIYYYNGYGSIVRDHNQARHFFKRSAELGHVESMISYAQTCQEKLKMNVGQLSATEVEALKSDSFKWYARAAKENHVTGLRELGRLYGAKGDFKASMECYLKASNLNDALSTLFLGGYYENGQGVAQNKQTALEFYMKAIELGQPTALFAIAELYEKLQDYEKAYSYYERVTKDTRISKSYKSSKTSRFKMALYSLNYDPNKFLSECSSTTKQNVFESIPSLLPKSEAFDVLMKLAKEENLYEAFNWIAECYQDGRGVTQNTAESVKWRMKSVQEANDVYATLKLASMYENGTGGVQKNSAYSHQLYQKCAERNNAFGQYKLGMTFWQGNGCIPVSVEMAVIWFTRSAHQAYAPSHWALGQIAFENGDLHIAIDWWKTALKLGSSTSPHQLSIGDVLIYLGKHIRDQSLVSGNSHPSAKTRKRMEQENRGLALQCFTQAAVMGYAEGMYLSAEIWHQDRDYDVALDLYNMAAQQGHISSRIMIAIYQLYGLGGKEIDTKTAYKELLYCSQYSLDACLQLGRCCEEGIGTRQSVSNALEWYQLLIDVSNNSEAMFRVGRIYSQELDSFQQSIYWYQRAIEKDNHKIAHFQLALYYLRGIKTDNYLFKSDIISAADHFRQAAEQDDVDAMFELGRLLLSTRNDHAVFPVKLQIEGLEWCMLAAEYGSCEAQCELGNLYHTGRESGIDKQDDDKERYPVYVIQQDLEKAYDYFNRAACLGDKTAALFLGTYYEHGICVASNLDMAQTWYRVAASGSTVSGPWWPAQLCLARVLHQQKDTQNEAYALFKAVYHQAAPEQHKDYLAWMLALYRLYGLGGVSKNEEAAFSDLLSLADKGYLKAIFLVARCYENGTGAPSRDPAKAIKWYTVAVRCATSKDELDKVDFAELSYAYSRLTKYDCQEGYYEK